MKSITVKITSKYDEYDVADEVMLDDVIEGFKYVNDFEFELVAEEYNGMKCPVCGREDTPKETWAEELKDMLSDAGLKPIQFKLNNRGVRIINRVAQELELARKETLDKVEKMLWELHKDEWNGENMEYNASLDTAITRLATLKGKEVGIK